MVETEKQMQKCLDRLGLPLSVIWAPDLKQSVHGKIVEKTIMIFDSNEEDAWKTFMHEIFEYKLKDVTRPYRLIVNALLDALEKRGLCPKRRVLRFATRNHQRNKAGIGGYKEK